MWLPLDYYAYAGLFNFITTGIITFYVISEKPELKAARLFCIFSGEVAVWSLFYFIWLRASERAPAEFFLRTCMIPVAFIPASFFYFVTELIEKEVSPWVHRLNYMLSGAMALIVYTNLFAVGGAPQHLVFPYWLKPGLFFPIHMVHFVGVMAFAHCLLHRAIRASSGFRRAQFLVVFWGMLIAFLSGAMNYLQWYRTPITPIFMPLVSMLVFAMGYAIVRHKLLDIEVVIRRGLVYSLLIACITAIYLVMVLLIEHFCQGIMGYSSIIGSLVVSFLVAIFFNPLRERIQSLVDKAIFHGTPNELASDRERLLIEVRNSERMKVVSTLAAGLAHEIKNPLAAIKTFTEHLSEKREDPLFVDKFQRIVGGEIERINLIVQRLLDYAKPSPAQIASLLINELVQETADLVTSEAIKRQIVIEAEGLATATIQGDKRQLKQVFLNLLLNAMEAMPQQGGRIEIASKLESGNCLITVKDNGKGIAPDALPHVFEPFYTSKSNGTGLGLAVVRSVLDEHGGSIALTSYPGRGTIAVITLPLDAGIA